MVLLLRIDRRIMKMYRIRFLTNRFVEEMQNVYCDSLWASYWIFKHMFDEAHVGDVIILYNPLGEMIEVKVKDYEGNMAIRR